MNLTDPAESLNRGESDNLDLSKEQRITIHAKGRRF